MPTCATKIAGKRSSKKAIVSSNETAAPRACRQTNQPSAAPTAADAGRSTNAQGGLTNPVYPASWSERGQPTTSQHTVAAHVAATVPTNNARARFAESAARPRASGASNTASNSAANRALTTCQLTATPLSPAMGCIGTVSEPRCASGTRASVASIDARLLSIGRRRARGISSDRSAAACNASSVTPPPGAGVGDGTAGAGRDLQAARRSATARRRERGTRRL